MSMSIPQQIIEPTEESSILDSSSLSSTEREEVIGHQSAPDEIMAVQQNNDKEIIQSSQQQQQQQQEQQVARLQPPQRPGSATAQHGATLDHPSLRNKMRRYREATREEVTPNADVLPPYFQKYLDGIKYIEVDSGREDVKRFKAVINENDPSSIVDEENKDYESVTIRAWMMIVYSGNPIGNQAAADLSKIIASSPFDSILFETPGCTWNKSAMKPFEFALVNEPSLKTFAEANPDQYAFDEYFSSEWCGSSEENGGLAPTICSFPNLGRDATLISPIPQRGINAVAYSHLSSFVRNAPTEQIAEFWKVSAKAYIDELKHKHERINEHVGTWFSTNGMGVAWLHLRLDRYPKYFSYDPFMSV